jgi:outer membrane protein TolC/AcrR family transcriptional regulator
MTKPIARREEILLAARHRFARHGYTGASMRQIAEEANVTKAALYYHFPDKATLFKEATRHAIERLRSQVRERAEGIGDPILRLRTLVHACLEQFQTERDAIRQLYVMLFIPDETLALSPEILGEHGEPLREALVECARAGLLEEKRVDDLATLLIGAIEYSGVMSVLTPRAPRPDAALGDRLLEQIIPGIEAHWAASAKGTAASDGGAAPGIPAPTRRASGFRRRLATLALPLLFAASALAQPPATSAQASQDMRVEVLPGAPYAMILDDCVRDALHANAALQAERMGRGEVQGMMKQAVSIGLPTFGLSGVWTRGRDPSFALDALFSDLGSDDGSQSEGPVEDNSFIPPPEDIPAQTFWRASINASWHINPMLIYNAINAANLGIQQQELKITDAEHRTAEAVMIAYYGVISAAEQLAALDAEIEAKDEFLEVARRRFSLGFATGLDTLRAAVSLANLHPRRRTVAQRLRDAGSQLNVLMGHRTLAPLTIQSDVPVELDDVDPDLAASNVERRPDVRQLDVLAGILRRSRGAQRAELTPSLTAGGSYGQVARDPGSFAGLGHDYWSASVSLNIPLFDGMLTRGRVQETEATIRRVRYQREEALRQARLEVRSILGELATARNNLVASELNMAAAEDALRQMTLRYEFGKADYLSVLDSQTGRFFARGNLIEARNGVLSLTASLKRALGYLPQTSLMEIVDALRTTGGDPAE